LTESEAAAYAEAAAATIALPLPEHCKTGVATNLARLSAMADALIAFPLPAGDSRDPLS
jgi:hypothetical protein